MEEWRRSPSWPDYEISSIGRVRRDVQRFGAKPKLRVPYLCRTGYLYIVMRHLGLRRAVAVHRLVAEAFLGPPPSAEHQAAHGDGNKTNNVPSNLRWATRSENERDKIAHGRSNRGSRMGWSKLNEGDVLHIRKMLADGVKQKDIAKKYGVAPGTIYSLAAGKSWAHLQ